MPTKYKSRLTREANPVEIRKEGGLMNQRVIDALRDNLEGMVTVAYVEGAERVNISGVLKEVNSSEIVVEEQVIPILNRWKAIVSIGGGNVSYKNTEVERIFNRDGFYGAHNMQHNINESTLKALKRLTFGV